MKLAKVALKDKPMFQRFLGLSRHELSAYAFENIYIWKGLYDISWALINGSLCIFFKDAMGCFLYLPPLASGLNPETVHEAFVIMDEANKKNTAISRIENVEEIQLGFFQGLGFVGKEKPGDYVSARSELAGLAGNAFKSKRASCNYFTKHYAFEYLPFVQHRADACARLYHQWMRGRKSQYHDRLYQGMLEDGLKCLEVLLDKYDRLGYTGEIVTIAGKVKAFTFGYELSPDTFCILFEVSDLAVKGLSQFIFQAFCADLKDYRFINLMDDSGLENLKRVKLSYRPAKIVPNYIVTRQDG